MMTFFYVLPDMPEKLSGEHLKIIVEALISRCEDSDAKVRDSCSLALAAIATVVKARGRNASDASRAIAALETSAPRYCHLDYCMIVMMMSIMFSILTLMMPIYKFLNCAECLKRFNRRPQRLQLLLKQLQSSRHHPKHLCRRRLHAQRQRHHLQHLRRHLQHPSALRRLLPLLLRRRDPLYHQRSHRPVHQHRLLHHHLLHQRPLVPVRKTIRKMISLLRNSR